MQGIRITRRVQVLPQSDQPPRSQVNFPLLFIGLGFAFCVGALFGNNVMVEEQPAIEQQPTAYEYGDTGTVSALLATPIPGTTIPGPAKAFDPIDWYAYLRRHPQVSRGFLRIKPNKNGVVLVAPEDYTLLRDHTGDLPPELPGGSFETKWDFFQKANVPLEPGEDWRDAMGIDKSYLKLKGEK